MLTIARVSLSTTANNSTSIGYSLILLAVFQEKEQLCLQVSDRANCIRRLYLFC